MSGSVMAIAVSSSPAAMPGNQRSLLLVAWRSARKYGRMMSSWVRNEPIVTPARAASSWMHDVVQVVAFAGAAVLRRHVDAHHAERAELAEDLPRHALVALPLGVDGHDLLGQEVAHHGAEELVVFVEEGAFHRVLLTRRSGPEPSATGRARGAWRWRCRHPRTPSDQAVAEVVVAHVVHQPRRRDRRRSRRADGRARWRRRPG